MKYTVRNDINIREAALKLDELGFGFLVITDQYENVLGIITDGDFRRTIIKGVKLNENIDKITNKEFVYVNENFKEKEVIEIFLKQKINRIPVISKNKKLIKILYRKDFNIKKNIDTEKNLIPMNIVIMAGGKGTRMKPFTNVLPKPLVPFKGKSIIEVIMDNFNTFFKTRFLISVNYKASLIKAYLGDVSNLYNIKFIEEEKPLGTAGAMKSLENIIKEPFFVSNCDIIIKANYYDIYQWHINNKNDITLITSMFHYKIPYGVCNIDNKGNLINIKEKPTYDFLVNTGMYIINPEILKSIPKNTFYNMTDLINKIKLSNGKIGVYPISKKSYIDIGQWIEYNRMISELGN